MKKYGNLRDKITVNPACLEYLAKMFAMDRKEVCRRVSAECGEPVAPSELFASKVKGMHLSAFEEIFGKDVGYFIYDAPPEEKQEGSILFRKNRLKKGLHYADRLLISKIEEDVFRLASLSRYLGGGRLDRKLKPRKKSASATKTAYSVREEMQVREIPYKNARAHLRYLIGVLADHSIVVHEHIESGKGKAKPNLAGFFLKPHTIVIKRESLLSREISTLAHELGHYLLDSEDIDQGFSPEEIKGEEGWCNEFAFHFVLGEKGVAQLAEIAKGKQAGMFAEIKKFIERWHVSMSAVRCHFSKHGSENQFITKAIDRGIRADRNKRSIPKPRNIGQSSKIYSPLETKIYVDALNEGFIEEGEVDARFNAAWMKANIGEGRLLSAILNG